MDEALRAQEDVAIRARRLAAVQAGVLPEDAVDGQPRIGLALSGGGIRAATFSLGMLRGLARQGLLPRVDLLSTVSGGGYIGAMLARLVQSLGWPGTLTALSDTRSLLLWWLRSNGRYLTPAGSRDMAFALATYVRAWLGVHLELGLMLIGAGALVLLPHMLQWQFHWARESQWAEWYTPWWPLAAAWALATVPALIGAYWLVREPQPVGTRARWRDGVFVVLLLCAALAVVVANEAALRSAWWPPYPVPLPPARDALPLLAAAVLLLMAALQVWVLRCSGPSTSSLAAAQLRLRLTRGLQLAMGGTALLAVFGALDMASWWLMDALVNRRFGWFSGLAAGALLLVLRGLAGPLQAAVSGPGSSTLGPKLLHWAGLLSGAVLVLLWLTVLQWWVFHGPGTGVESQGAAARWLAAFGLAAGWLALTGPNADTANTSSLHSFYRARLTRAYVAVGNPARFDKGLRSAGAAGSVHTTPASPASPQALAELASVREVLPGDDHELMHHRPEQAGGPLHLINTCLNQTRDDASGLYNADRKGLMLTASARGFEVGPHEFKPLMPAERPGTVGRWVAMSGAAAAPGAGSYTSSGWALLLFGLGMRLGAWLRAPGGDPPVTGTWRWLAKPRMLLGEAMARFQGRVDPWWYASDGGHFENTGAWALIKRELDFIIAVDAGADPAFTLGDLENLVRKARIDFDAAIEFYEPAQAMQDFGLPVNAPLRVLSPHALAQGTPQRGVLLARVRYRASQGQGPVGTLLVVKPHLHPQLPLDLLAYAHQHPGFPQQGTGDQFFDEAQWESYQRLGEDFGLALQDGWLALLPGWRTPASAAAVAMVAAPLAAPDAAVAEASPWLRSARAAAVGGAVGVGALTALLLPAWTAVDQALQRTQGELASRRAELHAETSAILDRLRAPVRDLSRECRIDRSAAHLESTSADIGRLREMLRTRDLAPADKPGIDGVLQALDGFCRNDDTDVTTTCAEAQKSAIGAGWCTGPADEPDVAGKVLVYWLPQRLQQPEPDTVPAPVAAAPAPAPLDEPPVVSAPPPPVVAAAPPPPPLAVPPPEAVPPLQAVPPPPPPPTAGAAMTDYAAAEAAVPGAQAANLACTGPVRRLFVHIYDESTRGPAQALRDTVNGSLARVAVPGVENVTRSAERAGRQPPIPWRQPTLLLHDEADTACAGAVATLLGQALLARNYGDGRPPDLRGLPSRLKPQPHTYELWLPAAR